MRAETLQRRRPHCQAPSTFSPNALRRVARPRSRQPTPILACSRSSDLEQKGVALPAAGADRREPEAAAVAAELVDHRAEDTGARGADRMAEGDSAAVDVHLLRIGV